jgi:hypothetical protein
MVRVALRAAPRHGGSLHGMLRTERELLQRTLELFRAVGASTEIRSFNDLAEVCRPVPPVGRPFRRSAARTSADVASSAH